MNAKTFGILALVVVLGGGAYYVSTPRKSVNDSINNESVMMEKTDSMFGEPTPIMTPATAMMENESRYVVYSKTAFDAAVEKKRVYFFHAPWCPTCRPADKEFQNSMDQIPEDVILFKTDYDSSTDLKKQYNVTYQHTFVQVDNAGTRVTTWNGGGIDELKTNVQ